jgi:hypothetical protein
MKPMMRKWGLSLLVLGAFSFILPMFGMQFRLLALFGGAQPIVAVIFMIVGVLMFMMSRDSATSPQPAVPQQAPAQNPAMQPPSSRPIQSAAPVQTSAPPPQAQLACPACGRAECVGNEFCGYTGRRIAGMTPPPPPPPPVAAQPTAPPQAYAESQAVAAPQAPKKGSKLKTAAVVVALLIVAAGGYIAYNSGMFKSKVAQQQPQVPKRIAGTISEFPVDTSGGATPWKPTAVSTQALGSGASPKLSATSTPPGITGNVLNSIGNSITTTDYKKTPTDTPVGIGVVSTNVPSSEAVSTLAQSVSQAEPGMDVTGVQIQSPQGVAYGGYNIRNSDVEVIIVGRPDANTVIYVYAPQPALFQPAEQLAQNIGNGNGLYDYPEFASSFSSLPAQLPPGMEMSGFQTFTAAQLGMTADQLSNALGSGDPQAQQWVNQLHGLMPVSVTIAQYLDEQGNAYQVVTGDFSGALTAWRTWLLLRGFAAAAHSQPVVLGNNAGVAISDGGRYYVMFQTGPHIAVIAGPDGSTPVVTQLGQALQL